MNQTVKTFFSYVFPSMFAMLIVGSYSIVDSIFIGQATGEIGLASEAITWPLVMLFGAFGDMLGTGAAIIISQERGKGNISKARSIFGNMIILQVIFSIVLLFFFSLFLQPILIWFGATPEIMRLASEYADILIVYNLVGMLGMGLISVVRNDGRPVLAMFFTIIGLGMNIVLDYVFIFIFNGGIPGAAYATVLSQLIGAVFCFLYFVSPYTKLRIHSDLFKISFSSIKQIILCGIPSLGNQLAIISMLFFHNFQAMRYGGVSGLAIYTFVGAVEAMGSLLLTGLALGIQPLVAYLYGAKKYQIQRQMGRWGYFSAFGLGIVLMLVSFVGCNVFPAWFNLSPQTTTMASRALVISSTAFLFLGVIRVASFYFQSTGKLFYSSILIYGDAFLVLPLCLFVLPLFFGLNGVWMSMPVSRVVLLLPLFYFWFHKRKNNKEELLDFS